MSLLSFVVAVAVAVAAAPAAGVSPPAPAPEGASAAVPAPLIPRSPGATHYGAPALRRAQRRLRPDPLRDAVVRELQRAARAAGRPVPGGDARLHGAMDDLASSLGPAKGLPPLQVVDFLLSHHGLVEAAPQLVLARGGAGSEEAIPASLADQTRAVLAGAAAVQVGVGVHRADGALAVVVALQERNVTLGPVPRLMRVGARATLAGTLAAGYADPAVTVTGPDGQTAELPIAREGRGARSFRAALSCHGPGARQVEVTGAGPRGTTVLANFPVFCGVAPPRAAPAVAAVAPTNLTPAEAEARLLELVNRDRHAAGLAPVIADARAAEVARAHSRDMVAADFIGHLSPTTGSALDRARRAGLDPQILMENVARAYSPEEAHAGLMTSPRHRANILHPQARRVGIGIVFGPSPTGNVPLIVTQLFL